MTARDTQRSRVYEFERMVARLERRDLYAPTWDTLDDVIAWASPVWRAERARYGRAGAKMPAIERPNRGQRRALAYLWQRRITLPKWARSPWVTLHEMAHLLVQANEPPHGPRFVGVLIGLACRHLDYDAQELMRVADEAGVRYHVKSIGSVPVRGIQWRAEKALGVEGPMTPIDLACWLSLGTYHEPVTWRQVQGAMLGAIAAGRIRMLRGKFHLIPAPAALATGAPTSAGRIARKRRLNVGCGFRPSREPAAGHANIASRRARAEDRGSTQRKATNVDTADQPSSARARQALRRFPS